MWPWLFPPLFSFVRLRQPCYLLGVAVDHGLVVLCKVFSDRNNAFLAEFVETFPFLLVVLLIGLIYVELSRLYRPNDLTSI